MENKRGRPDKQKRLELEARRRRVAELKLHGEPQWMIAQKEGVAAAQITQDLKAIRKEWAERRVEFCDIGTQQSLAELDRLQLEYWNAWARACEVAEKTTQKLVRDSEGDRTEAGTVKEWQGGNPAFLAGYYMCIDRKLKLFGKDAPIKTDLQVTLKVGEQLDFYGNANRLTSETFRQSIADSSVPCEIQITDVRTAIREDKHGSNGKPRGPRAGPETLPGGNGRGDDLVGGTDVQDD